MPHFRYALLNRGIKFGTFRIFHKKSIQSDCVFPFWIVSVLPFQQDGIALKHIDLPNFEIGAKSYALERKDMFMQSHRFEVSKKYRYAYGYLVRAL